MRYQTSSSHACISSAESNPLYSKTFGPLRFSDERWNTICQKFFLSSSSTAPNEKKESSSVKYPFSPLSTKIKVILVLMLLDEGFDVYYILIYSHSSAADTSASPFTNESIALVVQVRLKQSGLEPPITSREFSRVSFLHSYSKPYQRCLSRYRREGNRPKPCYAGIVHERCCLSRRLS